MSIKTAIKIRAKRFSKIETLRDLCSLIRKHEQQVVLMAHQPRYHRYEIPKSKGGLRLVEDPEKKLKIVQTFINEHLQAFYSLIRPECVYGFVIKREAGEDRTITGNAMQHLGCNYLLNVDLKDFFHQVSRVRVEEIFKIHFNHFHDELIDILARLTTYHDRLPMGAPSSPVLSNMASIEMDRELIQYSKHTGLVYSRYADDLSFSTLDLMEPEHLDNIKSIISQCGFNVNPQKIKWFGHEDRKEITGILLDGNRLGLPELYLEGLQKELMRYKSYMEVESRYRTGASAKKLKLFESELRGKINFALTVMPEDQGVGKLFDQFEEAKEIMQDFESVSWLDLPYEFF
ncbi:MAG: RNA-directed DNA polymerase [Saprospiraceae bacterium]|nr:RNA-directed DNA polymerase [Saprospiraceae bacterium]